MYDYARDTRSEEKMLEDFKIGKHNETVCLANLANELVWKNPEVFEVSYLQNELDEPGQFKTYQPDAVFTITMQDERVFMLNVEVKCTGFKLKDPLFIKAGQVRWLQSHKNPYFLIADVERYLFIAVDKLLLKTGSAQPIKEKGNKEFYLLPHKLGLFSHWTYGANLKRPTF